MSISQKLSFISVLVIIFQANIICVVQNIDKVFLNPVKISGPPFLILQETGSGYINMENITSIIWNKNNNWANEKVGRDEWNSFIEQFYGKGYEYFEKPLIKQERKQIRRFSKKWF